MSLAFYDASDDQLGDEGPTSKGWTEFCAWVKTQDLPHTQALCDNGESEEPDLLYVELGETGAAPNPDVEEVRQAVLKAAKLADAVLIVAED